MRIAWFSLLPRAEKTINSASAYFSKLILPEIAKQHDVHLFHDTFDSYQDFNTHHFLSYYQKDQDYHYDMCCYQIEDLKESYFTRMLSGLYPGISIFHELYYRNRNAIAVAEEDPFYDEHFLKREMSRVGVPVFMNRFAKSEYDRLYKYISSLKSYLLSYPAETINFVVNTEAEAVKTNLVNRLNVGFIGTTSAQFRADKFLPAVAKFNDEINLVWITDDSKSAKELINEHGIRNFQIVESESPSSFFKILPQLDIVFHLKCSYYDRLGPYMEITLANEKPYIIMNMGEGGLVDNDLIIKLEIGDAESQQIASCLQGFINHKDQLYLFERKTSRTTTSEMSSQAISPKVISAELVKIIEESSNYLKLFKIKNSRFRLKALENLKEDFIENIKQCAPEMIQKSQFFNPLNKVSETKTNRAKTSIIETIKDTDKLTWQDLF